MNYYPITTISLSRAPLLNNNGVKVSPLDVLQDSNALNVTADMLTVLSVSACVERTEVSDMTQHGTYTKLTCFFPSSALTVGIDVLNDLEIRNMHGEHFYLTITTRTHKVSLLSVSYASQGDSGVYFLSFRILPKDNQPKPTLKERLKAFLNFGLPSAKSL